MAKHTVEKIGGTSIADTDVVVKNVLIGDRQGDQLYNRAFVVSAYAGVTDDLLEHKKSGEPGVYAMFAGADSEWAWGDAITKVGERMRAKNAQVFGDTAELKTADNFVRERIEGVRSCLLDLHRLCSFGHFQLQEHLITVREMLSALGEAQSAFNTALLLQKKGVHATFVDLTGWRDEGEAPSLDERIGAAFADIDLTTELPIVTGYAHCREGMLRLYDRGYTEVTFSRIAVLTEASEAIIHKEFHLSSADPKVVGENAVRKIGRTNYDVADQLSNMGMEAVHPRAAKGLRQADIPLRVKNTFDPKDEGTVIRGDYVSDTPRAEIVTGIKGVFALEVFDQDMVGVKGYDAGVLDALARHKVRIISKVSNANAITHYVAASMKLVRRVMAELETNFEGAAISVRKVSIVTAIGSDLAVPGLTATAVAALANASVDLLGVQQMMRNVDIQFIVDEADFDDAIRALHAALVENSPVAAAAAADKVSEPA